MQVVATAHGAVRDRDSPLHAHWVIPVLEPSPGRLAARFSLLAGRDRHPVTVFFAALPTGLVILAVFPIAAGLFLTHLLAHTGDIGAGNREVDRWLAAHRTPGRTEASLIGSILAGGVVLPIVAAVVGLSCSLLRKWRVAGFTSSESCLLDSSRSRSLR
jgi:hypothetical protein